MNLQSARPIFALPFAALLCLAACSSGTDVAAPLGSSGEGTEGSDDGGSDSDSRTNDPFESSDSMDPSSPPDPSSPDPSSPDPSNPDPSDPDPQSTTAPATSDDGSSTSTGAPDEGTDGCIDGEPECPCDEGTCEDGLSCDRNDICVPQSPRCGVDAAEPNNNEDAATDLGVISDTDADGGVVTGVLAGAGDEDWFVFSGVDELGSLVNPERTIASDQGLRICAFLACSDGEATTVACGPGESEAESPNGHAGCCGESMVAPILNCSSFDDSATVWVRVDQAAAQCVDYVFDYHF